jgi:hypothetical protein
MQQSSVGHGGKRDGAGRPKGALNKITRPLREAAALESEACLETLIHLRDHGESEQVRLAAASAILDRGHGRPRQELDLTDRGVTVIVDRFGHLKGQAGEPVALPEPEATESEDDA